MGAGSVVDQFSEILLAVWRECGRRIDIAESAESVLGLLRSHMPADCLVIRHLDEGSRRLETIAVSSVCGGLQLPEGSTILSAADCRRVAQWTGSGRVLHRKVTGDPPLDAVAPFAEGVDVLAGPLLHDDLAVGILILASRQGDGFEPRHGEMMKVLAEPLAFALGNDRQVREIAVLREAAEADKARLLTRLGRSSLEDEIIGAANGLRSVMERVRLAAPSDVPVLFLGETGTGKELMAREIHRRSHRSAGPILRVNCGAIPHDIMDSQLFGHEKGSFTGASATRRGWFERADGGTLFLDEIGELPQAAQVRLLRILQDGWLERVGAQRPLRVDVRIIAATNRDLPTLVRSGVFREDLWYRISTFPILLPPLRERTGDIPLLARHMAIKAARRFCLPAVMPGEEDLDLLRGYGWPGNIRELSSVMERAAILGNGTKLEVRQALGTVPLGSLALPGGGRAVEKDEPEEGCAATLDEVVRRHIEDTLSRTRGRVDGPFGAAGILGVNPQTLRSRMKKLGIDGKRFREK